MLYLFGFLLLVAIIYFVNGHSGGGAIYSKFGMSESSHRLLSTDLGKTVSKIRLSRFGINGIPDAVFESRKAKEIIVGEFKSRKYRRMVRLVELYQITLYMGHLKSQYPKHRVRGVLAYADAKVDIDFDESVYSALIELSKEMRVALYSRKIPNSKPLHKRMNVTTCNRGLKFSAAA